MGFSYYIFEIKGARNLSSNKELRLENKGKPINDPLGQGGRRKVSWDQALNVDGALKKRERVLSKSRLTVCI